MRESRIRLLVPGRTREEIEAMQLQKLNTLLSRERARNGFYRELPECLRSLDELAKLPFTTEEDLASNVSGMLLCSQAQIQRVLTERTSGTTGNAKRVFYTETDCKNTIQLFEAGLGELVFPGSVTMICFPFTGPRGLGELIAEAVEKLGAKPLKLGTGLCFGEYRKIMQQEQPDTFVGMPAQLLSLLRACGRQSLKRALVSGDSCPETVISACEDILETKLFPHYGSREMALGGAICCSAHEGMHLRENHVIAEIIDEKGNTLPWGGYGELVITTIGMEAMPLVRYRTGDCARILPESCPCGSPVLRLADICRRESDRIRALDNLVFQDPAVADYRAWETEGTLHLEVLSLGKLRIQIPEVVVSSRPVTENDHILCQGKRNIGHRDKERLSRPDFSS